MEIVNSKSATLSNFEVMLHLQKIKDSKKKQKGQLATITYETLRFLEETPCKEQTTNSIKNCLKEFESFNLNKPEKLMIINNPPATPLEIQLVIEDSEERLSEDHVGQILQIIAKHFPHVVKNMENDETDIGDEEGE